MTVDGGFKALTLFSNQYFTNLANSLPKVVPASPVKNASSSLISKPTSKSDYSNEINDFPPDKSFKNIKSGQESTKHWIENKNENHQKDFDNFLKIFDIIVILSSSPRQTFIWHQSGVSEVD